MKTVIVTGGFDPLHSGHILYFNEARKLGDRLWVGLNSDDWLTRKKGQPFMSYQERVEIIRNLKVVDRVIPVIGDDQKDDATGAIFYAQSIGAGDVVFANGGDRDALNSPEEDFYKHDTTVSFMYGVGGNFKKNSSSWILNEWSTPRTDRSWGYYKVLQSNSPEVKLKELVVNPGSSLSMQRHKDRAEHWFVSEGTATVYTIDASSDLELLDTLEKHQSIHIKKNQWHQLCNKTNELVKIIEIQYGDNCIEADIERLTWTTK